MKKLKSIPIRYLLAILLIPLGGAIVWSLFAGKGYVSLANIFHDPLAHAVFFRLRIPRTALGLLIGSTLGLIGAVLQSLFRNHLAEPYTLGVSGGSALGASIAVGLGINANFLGFPLVFVCAIAGALLSIALVYGIAVTQTDVIPSVLLLSGVIVNIFAFAGVLTIQYMVDDSRAIMILRWLVGNLEVIGFSSIYPALIILLPSWIILLAQANDLHLIAIHSDAAGSLGVNVRLCEQLTYLCSSLAVGIAVALGGAIGFVGLIIPHVVRLIVGQDVRRVIPASFVVGGAFLLMADSIARTVVSTTELPVGAITGLLGGPFALWLLYQRRRSVIS